MPQVARRRITVDEFQRMGEAGILGPDERVELIDGELIQMNPIRPGHAATVGRCTRAFITAVGDAAIVWVQNPVVAGDFSEPQPDLVLLRPKPDDYDDALPRPDDTLAVVEVADSSLSYDRRTKMRLYARSGIPQAVIVDLVHNRVESYTDPAPDGYRTVQTLRRGDDLPLAALPDRAVPLARVLRPSR